MMVKMITTVVPYGYEVCMRYVTPSFARFEAQTNPVLTKCHWAD